LKKRQASVVGFYKDHGKTHPITKSVQELNRKRVVQNPKQFSGVIPQAAKPAVAQARDVAQELEDALGDLALLRNRRLVTEDQRKTLLEQGEETTSIDGQIMRTKQQEVLVKDRIKKLGS
jgi:hypothetical protein